MSKLDPAWVLMGLSYAIGLSLFLYVKWSDRKHRTTNHR